jgi:hypothetical protein
MKELLLHRLDQIAHWLEQTKKAKALIGLGSVGQELERLDTYSDLDFFVIAEDGCKPEFLEPTHWLANIAPVAYSFQNTSDGSKLLFADGVFCEYAIFESHELNNIPFAPGRIVWKKAEVLDSLASPTLEIPLHHHSLEWNLGEALTNILIGVKRFYRGEKLTAARFVQNYALDRVLELHATIQPNPVGRDPFNPERRLEQRHPEFVAQMAEFIQGYERTPESALALVSWLEQHFAVNSAIVQMIRETIKLHSNSA